MIRPALDAFDIQGNVLAGFNTDVQDLVALTLGPNADMKQAIAWASGLADHVSTVADVRASRMAMRAKAGAPAAWLAIAIGPRVLGAAQPSVVFHDDGFRYGMAQRARAVLGDTTSPGGWVVGGLASPVDVLLTVASNDEAAARARADALVAAAAGAGFVETYREAGLRLPGDTEHFGFRDGLSQPRVAGDQEPADLWPGHVLFGHPTEEHGPPITRADDPVGLTFNGSLLVFRRLAQDVTAFHAFCEAEAARLRPAWPDLTPAWLAALIVGRWPSGAPVSARVGVDPGRPSNDFDFRDDHAGAGCPFGAHIRKVNPRRGPRDRVDVPRLVRRGIPFGRADHDRGLLFMAYQASIEEQFEFLSGSWMNDPTRPNAGAGHDVLVGRAPSKRTFPIPGPNGPLLVEHIGPEWITPTGGAYLFAPGRRGLSLLRC